ncbi:hypothetical protein FRC06_000187 [Ceratobasidium sp. 370]|nr:hypothetical protein FRC06_000187 [Ceratobasidium sp. 370]
MPSIHGQSTIQSLKSTHTSSQPLNSQPKCALSANSASELEIEPRRSNRVCRPSTHKLEFDEYEASSRGSSQPPSPAAGLQSKSKWQPKWEKYPFGKQSERPGRIKQPLINTGTTSHSSSLEPPTTPGPQQGNHLMAS